MEATLLHSELFEGMEDDDRRRLSAIAETLSFHAGQYLFLLGDSASRLFVVLDGKVEICFPFSVGGTMKDIAVETKEPGSALGWSAFVKPYRFTLSARAAEPSTLAAFSRRELEELLQGDCRMGLAFTRRLAEIVGDRLLRIQALWVRELQRSIAGGEGREAERAVGREET